MAELFLDNIYLAILLPLWLFLIIICGRFFSVHVNKTVVNVLTVLFSVFGAILCTGALWKLPADKILNTSFEIIKINDFVLSFGLHVDRIGLIFGLILFLISIFIQIFAISYMTNVKKNYRYYALINLFNFAMAGLFFSHNLYQTYVFWEIVGVISYLLIGFEYKKQEKSISAKKVFLINRIGDTAFISAIIFCSYFIYAYTPNRSLVTMPFSDLNAVSTLVYAYANSPIFELICGLFIIAAIVKSAQCPFFTWLQDAMEAKLPVSALLHSSTMVALGIFLTLRLLPFYTLESSLLKIIVIIGVVTALLCSLSACAQSDPKKTLAYSTSAQLGLIFFAIGILNIKAAVILFVAHAFIKSMLFISLPEKDEKWNYVKFIFFLIGGLSLSGLIFSGMITKEIFATDLNSLGTVTVSVLSFLTAFYIIRIALVLYTQNAIEKSRPNLLELTAIAGLLVLNVLFYIYLHKTAQYKIAEPFWAALTAWICVYILYIKDGFKKIPVLYPIALNGFYFDKFYTETCTKIYGSIANICSYVDTNLLNNYKPLLCISTLGVKIFSFIETHIMNKTINNINKFFKNFSIIEIKLQNGNIQRYNAIAFIIVTIVLVLTLLSYLFIAILGYIRG